MRSVPDGRDRPAGASRSPRPAARWQGRVDRSRRRLGRSQPRAAIASAVAVVALAALGACSSANASDNAHPTWVPQQSVSPERIPTSPLPSAGDSPPTAGSAPGPSSGPSQSAAPGQPAPPSTKKGTGDPNVVATHLDSPTGLTLLPDGTALVGERATGRILDVQKTAGRPVKVIRTLTGLDTAGGGGLLDLALAPSYDQTGLILALITTARDTRVIEFTATGPVTTVLSTVPRGPTDNTGRLMVLGNGDILVGTGDAGDPSLATSFGSLAGKVLRIDDLGAPAPGNPDATSKVYATGLHTVNGLCLDDTVGTIYAAEAGRPDRLLPVLAGQDVGAGTALTLPSTIGGVGDCAISSNALYVTGLGGQDVFRATLDGKGGAGKFTGLLKKKYGRLLTVVAATDGSLWLTTSNKDGHGKPVAADERVLHITPAGGAGGGPSGA
jgi:glucose/arabinose dehydrogenase